MNKILELHSRPRPPNIKYSNEKLTSNFVEESDKLWLDGELCDDDDVDDKEDGVLEPLAKWTTLWVAIDDGST